MFPTRQVRSDINSVTNEYPAVSKLTNIKTDNDRFHKCTAKLYYKLMMKIFPSSSLKYEF